MWLRCLISKARLIFWTISFTVSLGKTSEVSLEVVNNSSSFCDDTTDICFKVQPADVHEPVILPQPYRRRRFRRLLRGRSKLPISNLRNPNNTIKPSLLKLSSMIEKENENDNKNGENISSRKLKRSLDYRLKSRYVHMVTNNLHELYCHCNNETNSNLDCAILKNPPSLLSPLHAIKMPDQRICTCHPFSGEKITCRQDSTVGNKSNINNNQTESNFCDDKPIKNCIEYFRPNIIDITTGRSSFEKTDCKLCKAVGCRDKNNKAYKAGFIETRGCLECRCGKAGGKFRCRNICKKKLVPETESDYSKSSKSRRRNKSKLAAEESSLKISKSLPTLNHSQRIIPLLPDFSHHHLNYYFKNFNHNRNIGAVEVLQQMEDCCELGKSIASSVSTTSCELKNFQRSERSAGLPELDNQKKLLNFCSSTIESCCQKKRDEKTCERGILQAKNYLACEVVVGNNQMVYSSDPLEEILQINRPQPIENSCCNCCWLGLKIHNEVSNDPTDYFRKADSLLTTCHRLSNYFSGLCHNSFLSCCLSGPKEELKDYVVGDIKNQINSREISRLPCKLGFAKKFERDLGYEDSAFILG